MVVILTTATQNSLSMLKGVPTSGTFFSLARQLLVRFPKPAPSVNPGSSALMLGR
ncbi:hypothetical protein OKN36_19270 [Furfurilactobacillus sp. OKN36]